MKFGNPGLVEDYILKGGFPKDTEIFTSSIGHTILPLCQDGPPHMGHLPHHS